MIRYVRIRKFCAETGYTDDAVRAKISQERGENERYGAVFG